LLLFSASPPGERREKGGPGSGVKYAKREKGGIERTAFIDESGLRKKEKGKKTDLGRFREGKRIKTGHFLHFNISPVTTPCGKGKRGKGKEGGG